MWKFLLPVALSALVLTACGRPEAEPEPREATPAPTLASTETLMPAASLRHRALASADGGDEFERVTLVRETRPALWSRREVGPKRMPLSPDGTITLRVGEDFEWGEDDHGVQVFVRPTRLSLPYPDELAIVYGFGSREDVEHGELRIRIFEGAPTAPEANVRIRPVTAKPYSWTSEAITVPENATLSAAFGVLADWPPSAGGMFTGTVTAIPRDGEAMMIGDYAAGFDNDTTQHWWDAEMDLAPFAGEKIAFRFEAAYVGEAARQDSVQPFWSTPRLKVASTRETQPPNIVLVSLDTLRADRMSLYGYERATTPRLDEFAQESVVFERAISTCTWTTPSHASMFTGKLPWEHGAGSWYQGWLLAEAEDTIAELLRERGYLTAAFTEGGLVGGQMGFAQGFWQYHDGPMAVELRSGIAEETFARSWEWIAQRSTEPFFLFMHTFEIHAPYCSPEPDGLTYTEKDTEFSNCVAEKDIDSDAHGAHASNLYDGGILYTDRLLGVFLDRLRDAGMLDNTVVIVVSDHGEEFNEHGKYGHNSQIYPEVIHVPLMIRMPEGQPARVADLVSTRDLQTTLGLLAGVPADRLHDESLSLLPLLGGEGAYDREHVYSHMPMWDPDHASETDMLHEFSYYSLMSDEGRFMINDERWIAKAVGKLPADTEVVDWEEAAFAYPADLGDQNNIADQLTEPLKALRDTLYDRLRRDGRLEHRFGSDAIDPSGIQDETMQEMDALGYL